MKVLAFGPHPDDLEFLCGGTLAKYAARGDEVHMAIVTNGEVGSPTLSKEEIAEIRKKEAKESAKVIGADLIWMGNHDEFLFNNAEVRLQFIDVVRQVKPDVLLAPYYKELYNPDHANTGVIANDIGVMPTVPNIKTKNPPTEKIPPLYFMDNHAGVDFQPEEYVDISKYIETKMEMLSKHKSQFEWLEDQYDMTPPEFAQTISRFRGLQSGVKYAEGFKKVKAFPRGHTGSLLPHQKSV